MNPPTPRVPETAKPQQLQQPQPFNTRRGKMTVERGQAISVSILGQLKERETGGMQPIMYFPDEVHNIGLVEGESVNFYPSRIVIEAANGNVLIYPWWRVLAVNGVLLNG